MGTMLLLVLLVAAGWAIVLLLDRVNELEAEIRELERCVNVVDEDLWTDEDEDEEQRAA